MYEERIRSLAALLAESDHIDPAVLQFAIDALESLAGADNTVARMPERAAAFGDHFKSAVGPRLDEFASALSLKSDLALLRWVASIASSAAEAVAGPVRNLTLSGTTKDLARDLQDRLDKISQQALSMADALKIRAALSEATSLVADIKEQAGAAGDAGNVAFYREFADQELKAATRFRVASIVLISATVGIAAFYALWGLFHPAEEPQWTAVVYRTAILVGIGALAAYLARQAGQHRRIYNWANALEVQLLSYQNFVAPMTDEERSEIRLHFARRVLGAPPDPKTGETSDDTVPAAQLIDLAMATVRRNAQP